MSQFEEAFRAFCGEAYCVGTASGTEAIALALRASGVEEGDEVLVPAVSAYPTTVGVVQAGAVPVFVDVMAEDGLMDPALAEEAIGPRTRAILPVHLYGMPCDMAAFGSLAKSHGLALVGDCAQAHGSAFQGRPVSAWSLASAWSFYPTKNLGAFGDGGAVTTSDPGIAERVRKMGNYGQKNRYEHEVWGINSRLDPVQAAILKVKLSRLGQENDLRRSHAARYQRGLGGLASLEIARAPEGAVSSCHLFPILLREPGWRDQFQKLLLAQGVETLVHFPIPMP